MSAGAGPSNRHLRGTGATPEPRGAVLTESSRVPCPFPCGGIPDIHRESTFYVPPEFLREADQTRAVYSQDGLYIPPHLPPFTGGYKYVNRNCTAWRFASCRVRRCMFSTSHFCFVGR